MQITAAVDAELRALSEMVGLPQLHLAVVDLLAVCLAAVPSCLALQVSSPALDGVGITTEGFLDARRTCRASLRLELHGDGHRSGSTPTVVVVRVFAFQEGAFAEFVGGADPFSRQGFRIVRRTVDTDITAAVTTDPALDGHVPAVSMMRTVNLAIGVLIDRGHLPEEALDLLHQQAAAAGRPVEDWAASVVHSARHD
jgi:hypothetical protein